MKTLHERLFHEESAGQSALRILFPDRCYSTGKRRCVFAVHLNYEAPS